MEMTKRVNYKNDLPNELIIEILTRLPVKSLMRFKCVSKSWFAIISNDSFAKSHFERSASSSHRILCHGDGELRSIDPDLLFHKDPHTTKLSIPYSLSAYVRIQGSCRGFIMLQEFPDLVIWNPSTGVNKRISYDHLSPGNLESEIILDSFMFGFGYDARRDDYLAIIVWCDVNGRRFLEYFSVRINKWERVEIALPRPSMDAAASLSSPGYYLNGAIHWDTSSDSILAFDMIEREFFEIPLPEPLGKEFMSCCLELLGGFLCLSVWRESKKTEIWVMKEYGVASSWTVYRIPKSNFDPLYFTKSDEIIGFPSLGGLAKYDEKGELRECMENWNYEYHFWMYLESLLSLPSSSGIAWKEE
ncbi:F-box/kelch-repeat protein At3g06240 [Arachis hypogaea]|uniref:F-box domain-containing protein n=1 Tax=Arachis hypogaea TaxID=3818 RepID=A0A445B274_ARAHY|nr:F-box/kelch-repeat protein At3g06240 [Arachis hypogaea]QHO17525.1 F-box/kelch-repeat protein [Arachis hypogaea]RYR32750.1 hypothetical protein Ahy_A10g047277 [Arachis hypogaea]